jgi:hypothetical protein
VIYTGSRGTQLNGKIRSVPGAALELLWPTMEIDIPAENVDIPSGRVVPEPISAGK